MTYGRRYLTKTVVEAAKDRFRHLYDTFDSVVLSVSGGKDSIAMLGLAREVTEELGIKHVDVLHYDEELVPDSVNETLHHYAKQPWVRMKWVCVPMSSHAMVMGVVRQFVPWDPARKWLRPMPEGAITSLPGLAPDHLLDQREITTFVAPLYPGRFAATIGIRADESRMRGLMFVAKKHENWITDAPGSDKVKARVSAKCAYPIYDWAAMDVLKFMKDRGLPYPSYYDSNAIAHQANLNELRWSTPLHGNNATRFQRWRVTEPGFYAQLVELFPEMLVQERYGLAIDRDKLLTRYGQSYEGVRRYIDEHYASEEQHAAAIAAFKRVVNTAKALPELYPPSHVLSFFTTGSYKRGFFPIADRGKKDGESDDKRTRRLRATANLEVMRRQKREAHKAIHGGHTPSD